MQLSTGIETQKERTLAMLEDKEFMCWLFERYGRFIWYTVKKVLPKDRLVGGYRAGKSAPSIVVYPTVTEPE